jgi:TIR domain
MIVENPQDQADGAYDVFVSYRHHEPDQTWVRDRLVPRLGSEGLRVCLDVESFRLGAPLVLEMGRAVESSTYTLAVLSPAYLESTFTELENVLAEHLGLEQSERRLIVVMREFTRPRLGMRARTWLDMTKDSTFEQDITTLCRQLRMSPEL